jgi:hypothetical protein
VWDRIPYEDEKRYGRLWRQNTSCIAVATVLSLNVLLQQAHKLVMHNIVPDHQRAAHYAV